VSGWFGDQDGDDAGSDDDIPEDLRDIAGRAWFGSNYQLGMWVNSRPVTSEAEPEEERSRIEKKQKQRHQGANRDK
jgi:hypothetical protein